VSTGLVLLAALMGLATYPWRAVPMLAPGIHRLPARVQLYVRLVGPAVLAALAAINVMVVLDSKRHPAFHVGPEWLAVAACMAIVGFRRSLLLGLVAAALIAAAIRAGIVPGLI
jgi:branched-subunit amino acid transport protein